MEPPTLPTNWLAALSNANHYETITPDCRRVRDDLRINGYDNFDYELERLKEKIVIHK